MTKDTWKNEPHAEYRRAVLMPENCTCVWDGYDITTLPLAALRAALAEKEDTEWVEVVIPGRGTLTVSRRCATEVSNRRTSPVPSASAVG